MPNDKHQQDAQRIIDVWEKRTSWASGEHEVAAEIARIRAEAAHEERDRCRMFISEGRHEFSRGEYYSRMKIHDFIDKIVKKIDSAIVVPESPSEPRTCETCSNEWDALTKEEMWDTIQRIRELTGNDGTESPERTVERLVENLAAVPRHVSAEDVEIVEGTIKAFKAWVQAKVKYTPYIEGSAYQALAALDRITGKVEDLAASPCPVLAKVNFQSFAYAVLECAQIELGIEISEEAWAKIEDAALDRIAGKEA
jgi:hypothetical protein